MLRLGFTTGTCAALAAAGAIRLQLTGKAPEELQLMTRKGITVRVKPADAGFIGIGEPYVPKTSDSKEHEEPAAESATDAEDAADAREAFCMIAKDAGDDCDATDGALIGARVRFTDEPGVRLDGGEGVGRVTKPGLDQPVGAAAINRVPRQMILSAMEECADDLGYPLGDRGLFAEIFVPEGKKIAEKTFNPQLGITGGISILGTTGIVEPMSEQALIDTIEVEIKQRRTASEDLILVPGNYGETFLKAGHLGSVLDHAPMVQCSNFIGDAVDIAKTSGFKRVLLVGHLGKFVKLAGGMMNTHSRMGDCRMEILTAHAACLGADVEVCRALMGCAVTDEAVRILEEAGLFSEVMEALLKRIEHYINRRAENAMEIGAVVYNGEQLLGMTESAEKILSEWGVRPDSRK